MTTLQEKIEEHTHEENQERSLIAASHRGDRDLKSRMVLASFPDSMSALLSQESAQKASDLHKQRTGKALLITEELVQKEMQYPEVIMSIKPRNDETELNKDNFEEAYDVQEEVRSLCLALF